LQTPVNQTCASVYCDLSNNTFIQVTQVNSRNGFAIDDSTIPAS